MKLEEMLYDEGYLSKDQFLQLQNSPRPRGVRIHEYIIREGFLSDEEMVDILATRLRIPKYEPDEYPGDPDIAGLLAPALAIKHRVIPLQRVDQLLLVAMTDPTAVVDLDAVHRHLKMELEPLICSEKQFTALMDSAYGVASGVRSIHDEIEAIEYVTPDGDGEDEGEDAQVEELRGIAEDTSAVNNVDWIITQAVREGASDVHISPERNHVLVRLRVDGVLKDIAPIPKGMMLSVVSRLKILGRMDIAVTRVPQDGRFTARVNGREINIRVSSLPTIYGENVVLRLLDMNALVFKLEQLGMRACDIQKIEQTIARPHGMILNTGPTGSGKTTTLYSILSMLNRTEVNIITVEDPVEYRVPRIRQVELNRRAGMTFAGSLRSMLRQDPDIAMIGEIRDAETGNISIQAALTGHLVLSTIHTNSAIGTVSRLIDMGIESFLISSVLSCVIGQRLVRRICEDCEEPYNPPASALEFWGLEDDGESKFLRGTGCHRCRQTGYRGRIGIYEVLKIDDQLKSLIANGAEESVLLKTALASGHYTTMKHDALIKVQQGLTTLEEVTAEIAL